MPVYTCEYTLPGERGALHKKSFSTPEARRVFIDKIKAKGGNIKSVSSQHGTR